MAAYHLPREQSRRSQLRGWYYVRRLIHLRLEIDQRVRHDPHAGRVDRDLGEEAVVRGGTVDQPHGRAPGQAVVGPAHRDVAAGVADLGQAALQLDGLVDDAALYALAFGLGGGYL